MGRRREELRVRARSVIPGRQRWDIGGVLGWPRVAELLEVRLRQSPGVALVHVNPVTGRLLIYYDTALSVDEVDQLVRETVALVVPQADTTLTRPSSPEPSVVPARVRQRQHTAPSLALTSGSAAIALALSQGKFLSPSPLVRLGAVVLATVVVVRLTWRRSRHPQIVGSHKRQSYWRRFFRLSDRPWTWWTRR